MTIYGEHVLYTGFQKRKRLFSAEIALAKMEFLLGQLGHLDTGINIVIITCRYKYRNQKEFGCILHYKSIHILPLP